MPPMTASLQKRMVMRLEENVNVNELNMGAGGGEDGKLCRG